MIGRFTWVLEDFSTMVDNNVNDLCCNRIFNFLMGTIRIDHATHHACYSVSLKYHLYVFCVITPCRCPSGRTFIWVRVCFDMGFMRPEVGSVGNIGCAPTAARIPPR